MFVETKPEGEAPLKQEPWRTLLVDAAKVIERDGWVQGFAVTDHGVCALGAIYRANGHMFMNALFWQAQSRLARVIGSQEITKWNDASDRTKEEVIAALYRASATE